MWITVNQAEASDVCYDSHISRIIKIIHVYSLYAYILKTKCVKMGPLFRLITSYYQRLVSILINKNQISPTQKQNKQSNHSIVKNRPRDIIFFDFLILFVLIVSHIYITWYCTQNTCHVSESKLKLETCLDWQF